MATSVKRRPPECMLRASPRGGRRTTSADKKQASAGMDIVELLEQAVARGLCTTAEADLATDQLALGDVTEKTVRRKVAEREEYARRRTMAPAREFMAEQNKAKLKKRVEALLRQNATELEAPVLAALRSIIDKDGHPVVIREELGDGPDAGKLRIGTIGLTLLGQPEVLLKWPIEHAVAADGIIDDIIQGVLQADHQPIAHGRNVIAARYDCAYAMVDAHEVISGSLGALWTSIPALAQPFLSRVEHPVIVLHFLVDLTEGKVLPGGPQGMTMALWRKKNGLDVFTGIVQWPAPSRSWQHANIPGTMARLVDPQGRIEGPCTILTPKEFIDAMAEYD